MHDQRNNQTYEYKDVNGKLLFQVVRYAKKGFAQKRIVNGHHVWGLVGGWYKKDREGDYHGMKETGLDRTCPPCEGAVYLDPVEPVLYRLPELQEGIKNHKTIYIPEGEKDADNLAHWGFVTTTNPMGAGKWQSIYTESLQGCQNAVILADKDKSGRDHAQDIAASLFGAGISVKIVELPDRGKQEVKDISDWQVAGGQKEEFEKLIEESPLWKPQEQNQASSVRPTAQLTETQELIDKYGDPYYLDEHGSVTAINQSFWAGLHFAENIELYEPDERLFYRYNQDNGLYPPVSESVIKQCINSRLLDFSRQLPLASLERKRTNANLQSIVSHLKGICEKKNAFQRDNKIIHVANGVIEFKGKNADFVPFSPRFYSRNQSPIAFDPSAKCDRFLNEFLGPSVTSDDAILLQKYAGLGLLGNNLIQRFLILDGKGGRGKSTCSLIFQKLIGQNNVTELRTKNLDTRFELYRYRTKTLLVGNDVPSNFLSEKGAHVIKALVGGDSIDAEQKGGTGCFQFHGNFCIVITSNSRLQIRLDGDDESWARRLLIVRFESPKPAKKIANFADLLISEEGSGILNWALEGLNMVNQDMDEIGDIRLTSEQLDTVDRLLAESNSLKHFLMDCVVRDEESDLSVTETIEAYVKYCPIKKWNAKPKGVFYQEIDDLMLELFATAKSHSIRREGKSVRGFRHVAFKAGEGC